MTLNDLLVALANNTNLNISLLDDKDNTMITFNAAGYGSIESDLGARIVSAIKVISSTAISISIEGE